MIKRINGLVNSYQAPTIDLKKQVFAEFIGTAALLCTVIGSGIMAERLSAGNIGVALIANTLATVFSLFVLIEILGPISGAQFNPLVTLAVYFNKNREKTTLPEVFSIYIAIIFISFQLLGAIVGAWLANAMFELPILQLSTHIRTGPGQWLAEAVATAGLVLVVLRCSADDVHTKPSTLVACYIGAAYWFTASTSFANPAAVVGRMLSNSFAGISPASALAFISAQIIGSIVGFFIAEALAQKK